MTTAILIIVSVVLAGLRIGGMTHPTFQALAHLFVGGLLTDGCVRRQWVEIGLGVALSAVELACFIFLPHS